MNPILWLILLCVLLVIELITLGLTTIWFAGGALAAFLAALGGAQQGVQLGLFAGVSLVLLLVTRPLAVRFLKKNKTATNAESLLGEQAVVTCEINNLLGQGTVQVRGMEWTARTLTEDETIEKDAVVSILKIEGVKLIVARKEGDLC